MSNFCGNSHGSKNNVCIFSVNKFLRGSNGRGMTSPPCWDFLFKRTVSRQFNDSSTASFFSITAKPLKKTHITSRKWSDLKAVQESWHFWLSILSHNNKALLLCDFKCWVLLTVAKSLTWAQHTRTEEIISHSYFHYETSGTVVQEHFAATHCYTAAGQWYCLWLQERLNFDVLWESVSDCFLVRSAKF